VVSPTSKLRITGHRIRAARLPDEPRYGENRGKKGDFGAVKMHFDEGEDRAARAAPVCSQPPPLRLVGPRGKRGRTAAMHRSRKRIYTRFERTNVFSFCSISFDSISLAAVNDLTSPPSSRIFHMGGGTQAFSAAWAGAKLIPTAAKVASATAPTQATFLQVFAEGGHVSRSALASGKRPRGAPT
jgi:hypothetical protein